MRFKGTPNQFVTDSITGAVIGRFDSKGCLEIEDERLAERMKKRFKPAPEKQAVKKQTKKEGGEKSEGKGCI